LSIDRFTSSGIGQGKTSLGRKRRKKMKTVFQAFARYNGSVNRSILELVEPLRKEQIMMETKAYYPSIFETLLHNFIADLNWLKRYKNAFKGNKGLNGTNLLSLDEKTLRKELESDYTKFFQYRRQMDDLIIQFANDLDESKFDSIIKYKNYKGEDVEKEIWKTLLHLFNHQTHHRGQVSVLLDLVGVDHDFSSMLTRI
jgi:uncharacterized damage-inducible protein DinB